MMRAAILAAVAGLAAIATSFPWSAQPAQAREAPWCAVIGMTDDGVYWDCQYNSFEQCRSVVVSGNPSPYATPQTTEPKRKARKGHNS